MTCSYYEDKGIISFSPYCHKKQGSINSDVYNKYCDGSRYDECPIYRGSSSSCYLTSACVYAKGLPDDCYELETLRSYRDNWLSKQEEGSVLIKKYYEIAPRIVSIINEQKDRKNIYDLIYDRMVKPCVDLIKRGKYIEAKELYKSMTEELEEKYC